MGDFPARKDFDFLGSHGKQSTTASLHALSVDIFPVGSSHRMPEFFWAISMAAFFAPLHDVC